MDMQDKEIDQLFRSEFENFAIEPSQQVWGGIHDKLNASMRIRKLRPYLSIAASILALVAIGIYFIPHVKVNTKKPVQISAVKSNSKPEVTIAPVKDNDLYKNSKKLFASIQKVNKAYKATNMERVREAEHAEVIDQPAEQITAVSERSMEILKPTVPDVETPLSIKTQITEDSPIITKSNASVVQVAQPKIIAAAPAKKHRINTLGDLINVVVSKMDKRRDKVIEFTNTEDDESTISGLNLGLIKIKKQE